ncbi:hypothetical protein WISP_132386 [Willisornis vidua]|uniref:Uncharacterized protein n=1 Tax=Willisornis vidua TaxID=1566151 RepID=A0ABQ9CUS6_9PASS|nr:hypothetical protein WISP_132386 [Willisornis vidua]
MWEASCWHPEYMSQICPVPPSDPCAEELLTDDSSYPASILRKRPSVDQAVGEKRKVERRVRFREPEVIEYESLPHISAGKPNVSPAQADQAGLPLTVFSKAMLELQGAERMEKTLSLFHEEMRNVPTRN